MYICGLCIYMWLSRVRVEVLIEETFSDGWHLMIWSQEDSVLVLTQLRSSDWVTADCPLKDNSSQLWVTNFTSQDCSLTWLSVAGRGLALCVGWISLFIKVGDWFLVGQTLCTGSICLWQNSVWGRGVVVGTGVGLLVMYLLGVWHSPFDASREVFNCFLMPLPSFHDLVHGCGQWGRWGLLGRSCFLERNHPHMGVHRLSCLLWPSKWPLFGDQGTKLQAPVPGKPIKLSPD